MSEQFGEEVRGILEHARQIAEASGSGMIMLRHILEALLRSAILHGLIKSAERDQALAKLDSVAVHQAEASNQGPWHPDVLQLFKCVNPYYHITGLRLVLAFFTFWRIPIGQPLIEGLRLTELQIIKAIEVTEKSWWPR